MPTTTPTTTRATAAAQPAGETPTQPLDLEARLAAVNATMTRRLETATLTLSIDSSRPETFLDYTDTIRVPVALPQTPVVPYTTPVAALLQRAHTRLTRDGWCTGAQRNEDGARCLYGAIHHEAATSSHEAAALDVLLEAIRRHYPQADSIPTFNDSCHDPQQPLRILDQAARLADARLI